MQVFLRDERLLIRRIIARVGAFDNLALFAQLVPHCMHTIFMACLCCANEGGRRDDSIVKKLRKMRCILIAHLLWRAVLKCCGTFLDFEAMLVGADREKGIVIVQLAESVDRITVDCRIEVTNVRLCVNIEDRRHHISLLIP